MYCVWGLCFPVFIACKVVYQAALYEFRNVLFGGFVGNIEALCGLVLEIGALKKENKQPPISPKGGILGLLYFYLNETV